MTRVLSSASLRSSLLDRPARPIFQEKIESPFGPAAGPHTQLAQNLIAAYAGGSRFFEVKTVQIMDGDERQVRGQALYHRRG